MGLYLLANGPMQTTAAFAGAQTGTAIRTLQQVVLGTNTNQLAKIVEWGISFDGQSAAAPIKCELFANTTALTGLTAYAASGIVCLDNAYAGAVTDDNPFDFSADKSGYYNAAQTEGTPAAVRNFDVQLIAPTNQYIKQFPLGREPTFKASEYVRIRVTAGADRLCYCYVVVEV